MSKMILIIKVLEKELETNGFAPANRSKLLKAYQLWRKSKVESFIDFYRQTHLSSTPYNDYSSRQPIKRKDTKPGR